MYNSLPVALLPVLLGPTSRMLPPGLPDHDHTAHNLTITSAEHGPATIGGCHCTISHGVIDSLWTLVQ